MVDRLPIIVLAGSDEVRGDTVPQQLDADDMLDGYKGAQPLPWGRSLAGELIHRLRESGRFCDPIVVGPRRAYASAVDAEIVNAEGNLVNTIRATMRTAKDRFDPSAPLALIACDVLPTPAELRRVLDESYQPNRACAFWWQLIEAAPAAMGEGNWKPSYGLRPAPGESAVNTYPGHLIIARPAALRVGLASSLLELAYRHRNQDIRRRHISLLVRSFGRLLAEDFRNLFRFQLPILTLTLPCRGLIAYDKFRRGTLTIPQLERHLSRMLLHRQYYHAANDRPVVISRSGVLSLAKDIDTKAELAEVTRLENS